MIYSQLLFLFIQNHFEINSLGEALSRFTYFAQNDNLRRNSFSGHNNDRFL